MVIGGPQGAGLETILQVLTTALAHNGYGVLSGREYHSNIIGRHSYVLIRVSSYEIPRSLTYPVEVLAAIDPETVFTHYNDLAAGGFLIYDIGGEDIHVGKIVSMGRHLRERIEEELSREGVEPIIKELVNYLESKGVKTLGLNYREIVSELREKYGVPPAKLVRYTSSIVVGAIAGLIGLDAESIHVGFSYKFAGKEKLVEPNVYIAMRVAEIVRKLYGAPLALEESRLPYTEYMIVSGNDVVAMGKIVGGVRFQSYYPITPAQDESFFLENYERLVVDGEQLASIVVLQTEDEIAAITTAIGASLAGARAATATSGPGFDLMVEGLSWAGINEVPVVITYYQRGGPSTGLPTRGGQSDLFAAVFSGHGEFPRIVVASGDHLEAFHDAVEAFNLAERYQLPVIHLLDKFLANSVVTIPVPSTHDMTIDRGKMISHVENPFEYKRFSLDGPVSRRAPLGHAVMWYTGNEHDEYGHITEDPVLRIEMYTKRMKKIELADREIPEEQRAQLYGSDDPEILLVGWGSVKGVAIDVVEMLEKKGIRVGYLHIHYMSPFPRRRVSELIDKIGLENIIAVEHSYEAQISKLIAMHTGKMIRKEIVKFTGRPIYMHELATAVSRILDGRDKVVLNYGA
ncbi:2-oxoglutarate oxidoreductase, alpha subunit [Pyrodictium delaneyi]|uniref:2-oxoacid oxidoreductase (ferredoxin) n=2 Tax=Pyrodictium delaneyi TaxID=1273541 RepID=A0A0P0N4V1_9CREN|nr:2-oxoglutarate oxidoreductase, alpha subunit [Pyrodictium delaneyi]OWJ55023.1 2-oxoacid:ferredoxin oxidoreductase subunit alpha [Pyrodictium delaneyi]